ncbi:hypothetical protein Peur_019426 [Populus x canadensis]
MEIVETSSTDQRIKDQSHEVPLDINELANTLRKQLKIKKAFSAACCIYRVPERLRKLNAEAYTPRVVSIGPIHHGKENLKAMEDHKIMYLQQFLEQSKWKHMDSEDSRDPVEITDCSRDGCSDQIFFPPWKLPDVIFDLCLLENQLPYFIVEELYNLSCVDKKCTVIKLTGGLLERHYPEWVKKESWKTFKSYEILHFVDFLRQSQEHTLVKETVSSSTPTATNKHCPAEQTSTSKDDGLHGASRYPFLHRLKNLAKLPWYTLHPAAHNARDDASHNPTILCRLWNLIKLPWNSLYPTAHNPAFLHHPVEPSPTLSVPTASELHQSGVKFKLSKEGKLCGIQFNNGTLEIPQLEIHDGTEILCRNLQAFEQCHHLSEETFVSDYITFMNCLVRAPNDVEVLVQNEILKNMLSSNKAVSYLFHNLNKENIVTNRFLLGVCKDLNSYCSKRRYKWKATLKQEYFKNPWTGISVIAATFLLILTTIQTVCSILQL